MLSFQSLPSDQQLKCSLMRNKPPFPRVSPHLVFCFSPRQAPTCSTPNFSRRRPTSAAEPGLLRSRAALGRLARSVIHSGWLCGCYQQERLYLSGMLSLWAQHAECVDACFYVHGGIAAHPKRAATHALSWRPVPDLPKSSKVSAGVAMLLGETSGFLHRAGSVWFQQ